MATKNKEIEGTERVKGMVKLDAAAFAALGGEKFAGLNLLRLSENEAVADLTVSRVATQKVKGRGKDKGKTREIPSYTVRGADGLEYRAPLNASFVAKAVEAKVKVGDVIAIRRGEGYVSKEGNKGVSFDLVVQSRAK